MLFVKEEPQKQDLRLNTIIGPASNIVGDLNIQGGLRVDGSVTGKIIAKGPLTVGHEGRITAPSIEATNATIGGFVDGDVLAPERIRLERTARVNGNLKTKILIIEEGAIFNGNTDMKTVISQV